MSTVVCKSQVFVLAVHADDELLGAFALLVSALPTVILLDPSDRARGSFLLAKRLGYRVHHVPWDWSPERWVEIAGYLRELSGDLWVTSPLDAHPDHRQMAALAGLRPVRFYSVLPLGFRLRSAIELSPELFAQKRAMFREFFPLEPYGRLLDAVGPWEYYSCG